MTDTRRRIVDEVPDTRGFLSAIFEYPLIIALVLAFAVGAAAATTMAPTSFEAEADVLVTPVAVDDTDFQGLGLLSSTSTGVATAARLFNAPEVTNRVIATLDSDLTREQMAAKTKVTALPQSDVVSIVASDKSARRAAAIANGYADIVLEQRKAAFQLRLGAAIDRVNAQRRLLPRGARGKGDLDAKRALDRRNVTLRSYLGSPDPTLQIFERAVVPDKPKPRSLMLTVVAFIAALMLGAGGALLYPFLSRRIWGEHDLPSDVEVLARIPRLGKRQIQKYYSGAGWLPPGAWEPYRALRARLAARDLHDAFPPRVLVTSSVKGEGKSMTSCNLAIAVAASGRSVVLLDANLREPRVTDIFGLHAPPSGLAAILAGSTTPIEKLLLPAGELWPNLRILAPGDEHGGGVDLVRTDELHDILVRIESLADVDVVVIDSPAIIEFADAIEIGKCADTVILAVRLGRTRRDRFAETRRILETAHVSVAGMVVTTRRRRIPRGWSSLSEDRPVPISARVGDEAAAAPASWTRTAS